THFFTYLNRTMQTNWNGPAFTDFGEKTSYTYGEIAVLMEKLRLVYEACGDLKKGDIIFKGANAVNLEEEQAGVLLGSDNIGTAGPVLTAVYGRRVSLIVPVGVEKRVEAPIFDLAQMCDSCDATGLKFLPLPGQVFTELHAIELLTGAYAEILAAGGICGAEGGCYFIADGTDDEIGKLRKLVSEVETEGPFEL
ncbi:MAG: hypothetical protein II464_02370, partial [Oscillospiraceae bacterium]|nr:hypothetical protein [Oscillospiraceae bacterium]